jgi:hypothetical protein
MMQNGFRRLALAQGLLPERPLSRDTPDRGENPAIGDAPEHGGADAPIGVWGDQPDLRAASAA